MSFSKFAISKQLPYEVNHRRLQGRKFPFYTRKRLSTPYMGLEEGTRYEGVTGKIDVQYPMSAAKWYHSFARLSEKNVPGIAFNARPFAGDSITFKCSLTDNIVFELKETEVADASLNNAAEQLKKFIEAYETEVLGKGTRQSVLDME